MTPITKLKNNFIVENIVKHAFFFIGHLDEWKLPNLHYPLSKAHVLETPVVYPLNNIHVANLNRK
ncbi:hypothetical protein J2Z66_006564 [Paenibacillus eucommiae]|uniref:Uncharacterized protein n=1 Tax=Paenibacillus eucommiae TaxID=1355755 RepID=A0ABS4J522_9BACL|nr:hypothetical protein [Paenibacillus eucommiae]